MKNLGIERNNVIEIKKIINTCLKKKKKFENVYKGERKGLFVMGDRAFPNYLTAKQYKKVQFHDTFHRNLFLSAIETRKKHTLNTYPTIS